MMRRSRAREVALQLLFQYDQNRKPVPRPAIEAFAQERLLKSSFAKFALQLYDGVLRHQKSIDQLISSLAENWKLHRMLPADRNVLRLGVYELLHAEPREPLAVVLDEAIELARRFGAQDSPKFVNGILDKVAKSQLPAPEVVPAVAAVTDAPSSDSPGKPEEPTPPASEPVASDPPPALPPDAPAIDAGGADGAGADASGAT